MLPGDVLLEILTVVANRGDDVTFCRCSRLLCRPNEWTEKAERMERPIVFECPYNHDIDCALAVEMSFGSPTLPRTLHVSFDEDSPKWIEPQPIFQRGNPCELYAWWNAEIGASTRIVKITPAHPAQKITGLHRYNPELHLRSLGNGGITNIDELFELVTVDHDLSCIDVSNVTSTRNLFRRNRRFNGKIGNWNTRNVTDMSYMFYKSRSFNQPIGDWNTSNVTTMSCMFWKAEQFNRPISNWNTCNVVDMSYMFRSAYDFNQPIGNWNTEKVETVRHMFARAPSFDQPLDNWNTDAVTDMFLMFRPDAT